MQLSDIVKLRNTRIMQATDQGIQASLSALQSIAAQTHQENMTLLKISQQGQNDSRTLKVLTIIATMYLPASLIAVSIVSAFVRQWLISLDDLQFEPDKHRPDVK